MAVRITFEVAEKDAPSLRAAIDDFTNYIGTRMESKFQYAREDAFVRAAIALGALRKAVNASVAKSDPDYRGRK